MKYNETFHYRWVQGYDKEKNEVTDPVYRLGKSNKTAKSKGGVTVAVFLAKDGEVWDSSRSEGGANQLLWVVLRCSEKENYFKKKARDTAFLKASAKDKPTVLVSQMLSYDEVRKVATHLMELAEKIFNSGVYTKNQLWKNLKNDFNIDEWVKNGFAPVNIVVPVQPLFAAGAPT